jgi:hypothetical protein
MFLQVDSTSIGQNMNADNDVNLLAVVAIAATTFMVITIIRYKFTNRKK